MKGSPYGMNGSIAGIKFPNAPIGKKLAFSISMKGAKAGDGFAVVGMGWGDPKVKQLNWTMEWEDHGKLDNKGWKTFRQTYVLTPETTALHVIIHNTSTNNILFTTPQMVVGESAPPDKAAAALAAKSLAEFEYEKAHPGDTWAQKNHDAMAKEAGPSLVAVTLRAPLYTEKADEEGLISIPLPNRSKNQVPVGFKLTCDKPGKLLGFKWRRAENGNLYCDARVIPGKKGVWLTSVTTVLVRSGGPDTERGVDTHLSSTACVQSADPRISEIAKKLGDGVGTDEDYAKKVFEFVRDNKGLGKPFVQLDAVAALDCGGSCTNQANLSAALLRAHGLPARTIAHMPTWCGNLYEHWLTEYWSGSEWVALDASLGRWNPDRRTRVEFGPASTDDENRAFEKQHLRFVMPGAPYQSVCELSPTLYPAELAADDAINWAKRIAQLPAASEVVLFAKAEATFSRLWEAGLKGELIPLTAPWVKVSAKKV